MSVSKSEAKTWAKESLKGLWTSPMIPVTPDGGLDVQGIRDNVEYLLQLRVGGLGFGFSEPWYFSLEERIEAFRTFVDAVAGRALCYCHAIDYSVVETVNLVHICEEAGADAVMLWTPMEFAKTEDDAVAWFEYVESQVDTPIFAYNTYHSGRNLSMRAIERIAHLEGVCALKDAVNDFGHTIEAMRVVGDQIVVSNPLEKHLLPMSLYMDQQVMLGTTSVFFMQSPAHQPVQDYLEMAHDKTKEAWERFYALEPLRQLWNDVYDVLWQKDGAVHPLATIKYWMDLVGMRGGIVRPPLHQMDEASKNAFRTRLEATGWVEKLYPNGLREDI
jgi:4-hydroxy-tetrahydrodipicolinate synthase